jgi:hypothetical protein
MLLCPKDGRLPLNKRFKTGPDDIRYTLVFLSTFEELKLPIKGPMEDAGVVKLYELEPFPTPCLYVAGVQNMVGTVPLMPLFLAGNSTPTIPNMFSQRKDSGFRMAVPTLLLWMDGWAAMSTTLTCGRGSLGAASPA